MSTTPKLNLVINQGATFRHKLAWLDVNKRPINITGFSAILHVRKDFASINEPPLLELTSGTGGIILGGKSGSIILFASNVLTANLAWTQGLYELKLISPSGEVRRFLTGNITVAPTVIK